MFSVLATSRTFFRNSGVEQLALAARLALGVQRRAQEVHGGDAGNFDRILEREKHALGGALVRRHLEQVFALEQDFAAGDFIARLAGDDMRERRFAGAVRPHDRVHFAFVHGERQPVEDLTILDTDLQIFDFEQWHHVPFRLLPYRPAIADERPFIRPTALQRDRNQLLRFHREFHRQLLQHILDEAVDDKANRLFLAQAALHAIKQHVLGNLRGRRFMLEQRGGVLCFDIRHGVRAAFVADQKRSRRR